MIREPLAMTTRMLMMLSTISPKKPWYRLNPPPSPAPIMPTQAQPPVAVKMSEMYCKQIRCGGEESTRTSNLAVRGEVLDHLLRARAAAQERGIAVFGDLDAVERAHVDVDAMLDVGEG